MRRLEVGSLGITRPPMDAVMAQTFLTLDHVTGGRAILGIGAGEAENILPFGMPGGRRAWRARDAAPEPVRRRAAL